MCMQTLIKILTLFGPILVAIVAIYYSNANSRKQILVNKLEELFEVIELLRRYYSILHQLCFFSISDYREGRTSLGQYYVERDKLLSENDKKQIDIYISRIEVLAEFYTKRDLKQKLLKHQDLVYAIRDLVFNGGSIYSASRYNDKYPVPDDFYKDVEQLKKAILSKVKVA